MVMIRRLSIRDSAGGWSGVGVVGGLEFDRRDVAAVLVEGDGWLSRPSARPTRHPRCAGFAEVWIKLDLV